MAEKKSTTGKPKPARKTAKPAEKESTSRVRKPKAEEQVQPTVEQVNKPREINWDVIGFSAAAVTLVGASILYLTGYTYLIAWYDYFGISSTQLRLPIDYIIAQSIVPLLDIIFLFFIIIVTRTNEKLSRIVSAFFFVIGLVFGISSLFSKAFFWGGLFFIFTIAGGLILLPKEFFSLRDKSYTSYIGAFLLIVFGLVCAGFTQGDISARLNLDLVGSNINNKSYLLVSSENIPMLGETLIVDSRISKDVFAYGPFTIIAENENSFYLIKQAVENGYVKQNVSERSGLFIIPRNSKYDIFFIPARQPFSASPTLAPATTKTLPTATLIVMPTSTSTIKPTAKSTITATITPISSQP